MMSELWDSGQPVPEAYSLLGYDNSRTSSLGPIRLTTVGQAGAEMGRRVGQLLLQRIEGRPTARRDLPVPRLVVRGTAAASADQGRRVRQSWCRCRGLSGAPDSGSSSLWSCSCHSPNGPLLSLTVAWI
jgi:hypothetical protein